MRIHILLLSAIVAAAGCDLTADPAPAQGVAATEPNLDDVPCDLLKGPLPLPAARETPAVLYPEALDGLRLERPWSRLSGETFTILRDSMTVSELGISSFRYVEAKQELTPDEYDELRRAIGSSPERDYEDYICAQRASCKAQIGWICVAANC